MVEFLAHEDRVLVVYFAGLNDVQNRLQASVVLLHPVVIADLALSSSYLLTHFHESLHLFAREIWHSAH